MPAFSDDPVLDFVVAEAVTEKIASLRDKAQREQKAAQNRNPRNDPDLAAMLKGGK